MRHCQRILSAVLLSCALAATAMPLSASARVQRIPVTLTVNGVDRGEVVLVIEDGALELEVGQLAAAGLGRITGPVHVVGGISVVGLAVAPGVRTAVFDERAISLAITVDASVLDRQVVDVSHRRPARLSYARTAGAYLNYFVQTGGTTSGFFEGAAPAGKATFRQTLGFEGHGGFRRGLSELRYDDVAHMRRLTIGDSAIETGDLGSTVVLTGITFARDAALDPDGTLAASATVSGSVDAPSRADVYVNGILVRQLQLQPGPFDLRNVPGLEGVNAATVVLHDVFGGVRTVVTSYQEYGELLRKGSSDYAAGIGGVRTGMMTATDAMPSAAALGRYAYGITDLVTIGARAEAANGRRDAGAWIDTAVHGVRLHAAAAASQSLLGAGSAWSASGWTTGRKAAVGISLRYASPTYATISLDPTVDRVAHAASVSVSSAVGRRMHAMIDFRTTTMRDGLVSRRLGGRFDTPVGHGAAAFVSASRTSGSYPSNSLFAGLSLPMGGNAVGMISVAGTGNALQPSIEMQSRAAGAFGLETESQVTGGTRPAASGRAGFRTQYGTATLNYDGGTGRPLSGEAGFSGGLALADGRVTFGPSVNESFVLLEAPGIVGGRAYANGQSVGKTNGRGDILVSGAIANYANRFSVDDEGRTLALSIQTGDTIATPPVHGGVVVHFAVQRLSALLGHIVIVTPAGDVVPSYGRLELDGPAKAASELGEKAEFYFDDLAPGTYHAVVISKQGRCEQSFVVPVRTDILTNLGILRWKC